MRKQIMQNPKGTTYLSQFMTELPVNCLFDKGTTGCGGTSVALENDKNTIIAMPYVNVIKNKEAQYPNDRCKHKLLGIYEGVTDDEIIDYINTHEIKKILVTYDSLERLITMLLGKGIDVYNEYYLLIDEWHILFNSYAFRNKAVKRVLQHSKQFKEVTYMTATPIEEEFILKELKDLPVVEMQWDNTVTVNIRPTVTNSPVKKVCELITDAINGKIFGNLHFFVNSVEFIAKVIKHSGLQPEQVRIICSDNKHTGKGVKSNQNKLGADYNIATTTDEVNKINFYTSTCFEGCDIYDENGKTYIVSDKWKSQTLLDISTLFIQICGRIRDSLYNTVVYHIFTETRYSKDMSFDEFKKKTNEERDEAKLLVSEINTMLEKARLMNIALLERGNKAGLNERYIHNVNGMLELDENLINLHIVNFKITKHLYQNRITIQNEYQRYGFNVMKTECDFYKSDTKKSSDNTIEDNGEEKTDKLAKNSKAKISFQDLFRWYAKYREDNKYSFNFGNVDERIQLIEREKPLVREAYDKLGAKRVEELNYNVSNIKRALLNEQTNLSTDMKILKSLKDSGIKAGEIIPVKYVNDILREIYKSFGIKNAYGKIKAAKATDLETWFEIERSTPKIKGKSTDCIKIIREKILFI